MSDGVGWAAVLVEAFSAGLGTAPFVALFMVSCERGLEGPQYALLSSIFAAAGAVAGAFSGFGVQALGWTAYFALTFAVAVPAFVLLPAVRRWLRHRPGVA
jgi:PAT family beta-lactamase induction signal transducer AmpG